MNAGNRLRLIPSELHSSGRPSATAQLVTLWRALELDRPPAQRIVSDEYAPVFLDRAARTALRVARAGRPVVRAVERQELAGIATHVLCRHAFIDEHLLSAVQQDTDCVLILGAGYDSRAYRFASQLGERPVYEVDLPASSRAKAAVVARRADLFRRTSVVRIEIDFQTQSLVDQLTGGGFARGQKAFIVWEGVVPYLPRAAVVDTLAALRELCASGSLLALDAWDGVGGPGRYAALRRFGARTLSWVGEPVSFGLPLDEMRAFLADHGWPVRVAASADDLTTRYATDGRRSDPSVYALTCGSN